jgi:hypothetical protein
MCDQVAWTWVVEGADPENKDKAIITDFFSMTIMKQNTVDKSVQKHDSMTRGHLGYYGCSVNTIKDILAQAQWTAKEELGVDCFTI